MADTPHLLIVEAPYYTEISEALGAGADDFDTKPVNLQRLLEKIEQNLAS